MSQRNLQRQKGIALQEWCSPRRRRIPHRLLLAAAACYSSTASIAESASLRPSACSTPYSYTLLPVEGSVLHVSSRLRGGGEQNNLPPEGESSPSSSHETSSYHLDKGETRSGSSAAVSSGVQRVASLVPSLFQINNNVKFDASLDDAGDGDMTAAPSDSPRASSFTRSTSTNGRGGAMLVKPKATTPPPRRIFQWLAPLETDRVAPLADRLLVDDGDASTSHNNDSNTSQVDVTANPTSYVPYSTNSGSSKDEKATTNLQSNQNEKQGQPDEASAKTDAPRQQSIQDGPERVQSTGILDASEDVVRSSAPELEVEIGAMNENNVDDGHAAPPYNVSRSSTADIDAGIAPESPFVSSGYVSVR